MDHEITLAARIAEMVVKSCPELQDGSRIIIDVGSHLGIVTDFLARAFPLATVLGIDSDVRCVHEAQLLYPEQTFMEGYIQELPLSDQSVDFVLVSLLLHHLLDADCERALQECWRVLKPGGILFIVELDPLNAKTVQAFKKNLNERGSVLISPHSITKNNTFIWNFVPQNAQGLYALKGIKNEL